MVENTNEPKKGHGEGIELQRRVMLSWRPGYNHSKVRQPPKTALVYQTADEAFNKLSKYWAVEEYLHCPASNWPKSLTDCHRHLFQPNGFHHAVRWMPTLNNGWRRMAYIEFCRWYGIEA